MRQNAFGVRALPGPAGGARALHLSTRPPSRNSGGGAGVPTSKGGREGNGNEGTGNGKGGK